MSHERSAPTRRTQRQTDAATVHWPTEIDDPLNTIVNGGVIHDAYRHYAFENVGVYDARRYLAAYHDSVDPIPVIDYATDDGCPQHRIDAEGDGWVVIELDDPADLRIINSDIVPQNESQLALSDGWVGTTAWEDFSETLLQTIAADLSGRQYDYSWAMPLAISTERW